MGHAKLSVTIPDDIYKEIKILAAKEKIKLSHLVTDALAEKTKRMKEDELIQRINMVFEDPEVAEGQIKMANLIADNTDVEELPW